MCSFGNTGDGNLQDRSVYLRDILYDLGRILHDVDNEIDESGIIVLDQAGVFSGNDDFKILLLLELIQDTEGKIILNDSA